ncbi:MAG: class I SAM-dependent methyltransferase [Pseudomonadota bacterium]
MHSSALSEVDQTTAASASKARFWNKIARKYARDPITDLAAYEKTIQRVQALLSPEHEVLEIGCGTGSTALRLAPGIRRMVACDVSEEMIHIAREKLLGQSPSLPIYRMDFRVADADTALSSQPAYDAVLAFNLLHLANNLPQTLQSALKALKPGGLFISKTPCLNDMNPLIPRLALPLMRALGKAPHVLCFSAEQLQEALVWQGLEIVSVEWHGSRGKDFRPFIVARKPAASHQPPR